VILGPVMVSIGLVECGNLAYGVFVQCVIEIVMLFDVIVTVAVMVAGLGDKVEWLEWCRRLTELIAQRRGVCEEMLLLLMCRWNVRVVVRIGSHGVVRGGMLNGWLTLENEDVPLPFLIYQCAIRDPQPHADALHVVLTGCRSSFRKRHGERGFVDIPRSMGARCLSEHAG
jgi:hypothetical protein